MIGRVLEVHDERLGGEVTVAAVSGDTEIVLDDASDFEEDGGSVVGSTGLISTYTATDYDTSTLTLEEAVGVAVAAGFGEGDWAAPWSEDHEDTVRVAAVDVGDGPELVAVVRHALRGQLRPGTREPGQEEIVEVQESDDEVVIVNIRGKEPSLIIQDFTVQAHVEAPPAGFLRLYATYVGGIPQMRVKNSDNSTEDLTSFVDGA